MSQLCFKPVSVQIGAFAEKLGSFEIRKCFLYKTNCVCMMIFLAFLKIGVFRKEKWVLPYLGIVGRFRSNRSCFVDFQSDCIPILCFNLIRMTPSLCRKNWFVSITFSSKDIKT